MKQAWYPTLYRGSVKDVLGPVQAGAEKAVVFQYMDAYSVFDWGRMPDPLPRKGEALAVLAGTWFEQLELADTWREFSRSSAAQQLRRGSRFGAAFNELGEVLQNRGLRTHYLGALSGEEGSPARPLSEFKTPVKQLAVRHVSVVRPVLTTVLGRSLPDYFPTRNSPPPRLVPLEVVFRFSCPEGSSLLERVSRDSGYLASIGFPETKVEPGKVWDFPVIELFTKLETTDRPVSLSEGLAISGLSAAQMQTLLLSTAWVAGWLKWTCAQRGVELADGKVEWGVSEKGETFLVDAIGPDELRLLKNGVQLSKEFLRAHYRRAPWYESLQQAKERAKTSGTADWKKFVVEGPPKLPQPELEAATQMYLALANELTGRKWFPEAWTLERVAQAIGGFAAGAGR